MAKKQAQPKVEILLDIGLCGERTKDDDLVDWDHVDMRVVPAVHAASIFLRLAIVAK